MYRSHPGTLDIGLTSHPPIGADGAGQGHVGAVGVKYMRFVRDEFFEDQPMDDLNTSLLPFAS